MLPTWYFADLLIVFGHGWVLTNVEVAHQLNNKPDHTPFSDKKIST